MIQLMVPSSYGLKNGGECRFRAQAGGVLLLGVVAGGGGVPWRGNKRGKGRVSRRRGREWRKTRVFFLSLSLSLSVFSLPEPLSFDKMDLTSQREAEVMMKKMLWGKNEVFFFLFLFLSCLVYRSFEMLEGIALGKKGARKGPLLRAPPRPPSLFYKREKEKQDAAQKRSPPRLKTFLSAVKNRGCWW